MISSLRAATLGAPEFLGGVDSVSWTSLREGLGRAAIYAAVALEGALVVTFFVAVQLLLNRDYLYLSGAQYGAVYVPLFAAAVLAALLAARGSRVAARGRVLRLGLTMSAAGRAALIPAILGVVRHAAAFFPELVISGALTGAGFALVYSAATAFELDVDPAQPEGYLLRFTLTLAAGMAVGPALQIGLVEAGLWWVFPVIATVLAALLIAVSSQRHLGPDAARSCALRHPAKPVPARVKAYIPVAFLAIIAVTICVAWSQVGMIGPVTAHISTRALGLGAFWAALAVLACAAFWAIDMRARWRRTATVGLFLLPALVTVIGLAIGRAETTVIGIFLLAAVTCAALLPAVSQLTQRQLFLLPITVGAGIIAIYPVAIALARPSLNALRSSGASLSVTFAVTDIVAIAASLTCAVLIAFRRASTGQGGTLVQAVPPPRVRPGTAVEQRPVNARPCTAVEAPRSKTGSYEDEDQPDA